MNKGILNFAVFHCMHTHNARRQLLITEPRLIGHTRWQSSIRSSVRSFSPFSIVIYASDPRVPKPSIKFYVIADKARLRLVAVCLCAHFMHICDANQSGWAECRQCRTTHRMLAAFRQRWPRRNRSTHEAPIKPTQHICMTNIYGIISSLNYFCRLQMRRVINFVSFTYTHTARAQCW